MLAASSQTNRLLLRGNQLAEPPFCALPNALVDSAAYIALTDKAKVLLTDLIRHYNGHNNGDLAITLKTLRARGWTSNDSLTRAKVELLQAGLIIQTRQGGRHKCSLFALAWCGIDDCGGKIEVKPNPAPMLILSKLERAAGLSAGNKKIPAPPAGTIPR